MLKYGNAKENSTFTVLPRNATSFQFGQCPEVIEGKFDLVVKVGSVEDAILIEVVGVYCKGPRCPFVLGSSLNARRHLYRRRKVLWDQRNKFACVSVLLETQHFALRDTSLDSNSIGQTAVLVAFADVCNSTTAVLRTKGGRTWRHRS